MRKLMSLIFTLILCMSLAVSASAKTAVESNPGGEDGPESPKTGSSIVAVLALTSCVAGGVGAVAYKKSKE